MPPTRAQTFRRRRLAVFGALTALLVGGAYIPMTLFAPLEPTAPMVAEAIAPTTVAAELAWPDSVAIGVGAVGFPGVLAATGSTEALPMASITKIVAALTVLEQHPLAPGDRGPAVTLTSIDVGYYSTYEARGATVKPVRAGVVLSQYELLQAVLLPSAANYAHTMAIWAFGSHDAFRAATDQWLADEGLTDTTVVEPTGLDPLNVSTVHDLIVLGKLALAHPVVAEIVATPIVDLPGAGLLENSNEILGSHGIDGIKTGTLPESGACLLFSSDFTVGDHTVTIVGVALGGVRHAVQYPQVQSLVQSVQGSFREVVLAELGQAFGSYTTEWGDSAEVVASESRSALVWGDTPISVSVLVDPVSVASASTRVGVASYTVGQDLVEVPLVLSADIEDPGPFWRLGNPALVFG